MEELAIMPTRHEWKRAADTNGYRRTTLTNREQISRSRPAGGDGGSPSMLPWADGMLVGGVPGISNGDVISMRG